MKKSLLILIIISPFLLKGQELKREFYPNGRVKSEGYFVNGKKHGTYKEFYESKSRSR